MNQTIEKKKRVQVNDLHMKSSGNAFDYSQNTRRMTLDAKWLSLSALILVCLANVAAFVYLLAADFGIIPALFPMITAAVSLVFALVSLRISFQFGYALRYLIIYLIIFTALFITTVVVWMTSEKTDMNATAALTYAAAQVALCLLLAVGILVARHRTPKRSVLGAVVLVLMAAVIAVGVWLISKNGFFGEKMTPETDPTAMCEPYTNGQEVR